jgi:glutathione S-transferase
MVAKSEAAVAAMSKFIGRARHAASPDQEISRKEYTVPANVPRQLCLAERTWLVGDRLSYADFRVASALPFAARPDCRCTSSPASPAGRPPQCPRRLARPLCRPRLKKNPAFGRASEAFRRP